MAGLSLRNVYKRYGNTVAVRDFTLEIADEELIVLVGPSGCGKSTTLRMVAGLEDISEGEICIGERVVNAVEPKDRDIAMVFQSYALYPHMTVFENMAFGLRLRKVSKQAIEARVRKASETLRIEDLLQRKPRQLSGGQRQRVAMGRAIVREPAVFLFDEPLSNLDAKLRVQMRSEIAKLHNRLRTTILYVTHDQMEAMTLADRIVVMKDGEVRQVGSPLEVYDRPADKFVGSFIGSPAMNFVSCTITATPGAETLALEAPGVHLSVPTSRLRGASVSDGREVTVGMRPEHFVDGSSPRGPESPEMPHVEGTVEVVEPVGAEVYVELSVGGHPLVARVRRELPMRIGDRLSLGVDGNKVHLFDVATEQAITAWPAR
ncbi:MAG: sn-glycerol-3-phosphate ABC transporter ATP-binding protein UgpC [Candidatus Schekmanbacteria bacterium]|nr:sn-glycerol-3-phosphate ABC transporter ATP-binding protein UgpC [Candidatus Schekmanbacteria bacterium]